MDDVRQICQLVRSHVAIAFIAVIAIGRCDRFDGLITEEETKKTIHQLLALQKENGGWALATLGDWKRADGKPQDLENSDGYGTGFMVYALRQGGLPADEPSIQRGVAWLRSNQRASGRWFTRSLNKDNKHYISHAGTAMAVMALSACEQEQ